jgi:hypothetical protein
LLLLCCLERSTAGAQQGPGAPAALPVVTLDGPPGGVSSQSAGPQPLAPLPLLPATRLDDAGRGAERDAPRNGPRQQQTRFYSIDHLATARAGVDFFADIGAGVQSLLSASGRYHVNRKASLVHVTDFADRLDVVAAYLEFAQLRASRQVRIQARILEVSSKDGIPIDWGTVAARPQSGIRRGGADAVWRVDDVDAWLRAAGEIGSVRHIGAPALLAMNNEPAILRAVDSAPHAELELTVTPQIAADRVIRVHVAPRYDDGPFKAAVDTVVRIADGETVLVGSLQRRRDVPSHAEVVVLLTATVVTPGGTGAESRPASSGSGRR